MSQSLISTAKLGMVVLQSMRFALQGKLDIFSPSLPCKQAMSKSRLKSIFKICNTGQKNLQHTIFDLKKHIPHTQSCQCLHMV